MTVGGPGAIELLYSPFQTTCCCEHHLEEGPKDLPHIQETYAEDTDRKLFVLGQVDWAEAYDPA